MENLRGVWSKSPDEEEHFMKVRILSLFALAAMALALSAPLPAGPSKAASNAVPAAKAQPAAKTAVPAEPHPQIREAIGALRRAKEHLQHAAHDFGGHRVDAIRAIDAAMEQLEACLKYDKD
jgi:hypothetical protein